MRIIPAFSVLACAAMLSACGARSHAPSPEVAPYLLQVPAPGTDYRYRTGPQGFGRVGPVAPPQTPPHTPVYPPEWRPHHHGQAPHYPSRGAQGHGHESHGWSDSRRSVTGGVHYELRESATVESRFETGVIHVEAPPPSVHGARAVADAPAPLPPVPYETTPYERIPNGAVIVSPPPVGPVPYETAPHAPAPLPPVPYEPIPYQRIPHGAAIAGPVIVTPLPPPVYGPVPREMEDGFY